MFFKSKERKIREIEQQLNRADTNHILHLILSVVTAGIWLPIWVLTAINNATVIRHLNNELDKAYRG